MSRFLDEMGEGAVDDLLSISDAGLRGQFVRALGRAGSGSALTSRYLVRNALDAYTQLSQGAKRLVQRTFRSADDGSIRLLNQEACYNPCPAIVGFIYDRFHFSANGPLDLEFADLSELVDGLRQANPSVGPAKQLSDRQVVETINELAEKSNIAGLEDILGRISGTASGYKGAVGEVSIADGLSSRYNNIDMRLGVEDVTPDSDIRNAIPEVKSYTEIDVNIREGTVRIGDTELDTPAIESKYWDLENRGPFPKLDDQLDELRNKLVTQVAAGETDLAVVFPEETLEILREGPDVDLGDVDVDLTPEDLENLELDRSLGEVINEVENIVDDNPEFDVTSDDLTIETTSFKNVES